MNENEKYLITGVEDGWIKVDKATWDYYQYLKTKERMKNEKMWENISQQETIRMAFPRGWDKIKYWGRKPQAYTLEKALETLQTMLATQDINLMIDWAYNEFIPPNCIHSIKYGKIN